MIRSRRQLCLVVVLFALVVLIVPGVASAAPLAGSTQVDSPPAPTFSIPGVVTLTLGQGFTNTGEEVMLDTAEIRLDAVNAIATVNGLTLGPSFMPTGWDSIVLAQNTPLTTANATVSELQASVGGPKSGYSTLISANLDLHPGSAAQLSGTFGVGYDGLARSFGVGVRDGEMALQAGPVSIAASGVNTGQGAMTMDTLDATVAATGTSLNVSGLSYSSEGLDWDTLDITQPPLNIGNAVSVTPFTLRVGGSETGHSMASVVGLELAGDAVQMEGELVTVFDGMTKQASFGLQNMNLTVAVPAASFAVQGMDTGTAGTSIDTLTMTVTPLNLTAEVNGMAKNEAGQFVFDDATIRYAPQGESGTGGGFEMTVTRQDEGYILTTTTILPTARK